MADLLQLTHIISQSLSEGIKGGREEERKKVRSLSQPSFTTNDADVVSTFHSLTG